MSKIESHFAATVYQPDSVKLVPTGEWAAFQAWQQAQKAVPAPDRFPRKALKQSVVAIGLCVGLAGCQTAGSTTPGAVDPIAQVQAAAQTACRFLPTAATVASIIAAANPALSTAGAVAQAICSAVTAVAPSSAPRALAASATGDRTYGAVGSVLVQGRFI